ncbi:MAG: GNAT family N-acetyltransferase [Egibacteraceae bacterium]
MRIERLDERHDRSRFACGVAALDGWFREHALTAQKQDTARTFVLIDDLDQPVGYYSLTMGSVTREEAPRRLVRGLPAYPVPVVLLARLAIDQKWQGQGLGISLLYEAVHRAMLAAEHAAARLIAVDPIDGHARAFYARWGFRAVEGDTGGRLFVRTRDALASLPADYQR